jgi:hypothetical protein
MDGALRKLGRSNGFERPVGVFCIRASEGLFRTPDALEVPGILTSLVELFLARRLQTVGADDILAKCELLCDAGKEDEDFLKVFNGFRAFGVLLPWRSGPGAELEACRGNLGLPAVGSDILIKLEDLLSPSCVFLGADGVLPGVEMGPECFIVLGVVTSLRPTRGDL